MESRTGLCCSQTERVEHRVGSVDRKVWERPPCAHCPWGTVSTKPPWCAEGAKAPGGKNCARDRSTKRHFDTLGRKHRNRVCDTGRTLRPSGFLSLATRLASPTRRDVSLSHEGEELVGTGRRRGRCLERRDPDGWRVLTGRRGASGESEHSSDVGRGRAPSPGVCTTRLGQAAVGTSTLAAGQRRPCPSQVCSGPDATEATALCSECPREPTSPEL